MLPLRLCEGRYCFLVLDNSTFSEVFGSTSGGFRLYNQYCVFVYTQLQKILPDSFLGAISDWDKYMSLNMDDVTLPFKTVDDMLQDHDLSDLLSKSKISTPRRFVGQVIAFYKHFIKLLLINDVATSAFVRGLSAFDEPVVRSGREADYTDAIQSLAGYFVQQKWMAPHTKPVVVSEYCSLVTKLRSENFPTVKDWVGTFSCHYELQCRIELFHLFKTCCQALRGPCPVPTPFKVTIPGLKSSNFEFASCVSSLQCSLASIQKCESLFMDSAALPRAYELVNRGPGLILKRNFSVWNILSSTHFPKTGLLSSLNGYYAKSERINYRSWIVADETASLSPVRSSSAEGTPVKRVPGSADSTPSKNPVVRRLTEVPVISEVPVKVVSKKNGNASVL